MTFPIFLTTNRFFSLTNSSSIHRLDLSPFIDTNSIFSSSSELNTPSPTTSQSKVYQPSDIVALLESSSSDQPVRNKSADNSIHDVTNTFNNVPPSCSSAACQETLLSSLFNSFDPFNKLYSNDNQSSRYNHLSSLITTAPDNTHYPLSYGHNLA